MSNEQAKRQEPRYMNTEQCGEYIGLSPRTLEGMRWEGSGPPFAKLSPGRSGRIIYDRELVDAWIAERMRQSNNGGAA